jgi:autoinducer 2-degrading protein
MSQQPIHVFARWQAKEGQVDQVLHLLIELSQKSREEEGNLFYQVHQSITDPNILMLFEGYKDEAALAAHRSSDHFQALVVGKALALLVSREAIVSTPLTLG